MWQVDYFVRLVAVAVAVAIVVACLVGWFSLLASLGRHRRESPPSRFAGLAWSGLVWLTWLVNVVTAYFSPKHSSWSWVSSAACCCRCCRCCCCRDCLGHWQLLPLNYQSQRHESRSFSLPFSRCNQPGSEPSRAEIEIHCLLHARAVQLTACASCCPSASSACLRLRLWLCLSARSQCLFLSLLCLLPRFVPPLATLAAAVALD